MGVLLSYWDEGGIEKDKGREGERSQEGQEAEGRSLDAAQVKCCPYSACLSAGLATLVGGDFHRPQAGGLLS